MKRVGIGATRGDRRGLSRKQNDSGSSKQRSSGVGADESPGTTEEVPLDGCYIGSLATRPHNHSGTYDLPRGDSLSGVAL